MKNKAKKFKGFTLAEVLITLIIIGVVSALTIPGVIVNYQKEQTVLKLKKTYNALYNAYRTSIIEYGTAEKWDYGLSAKDFYIKYLSPHLNDTICQSNIGNCKSYKIRQTINSDYIYYFTPSAIFSDGTYMQFGYDNGFQIFIDINGSNPPNTNGKDLFYVGINNKTDSSTCKHFERFGFFCQWCGACLEYGKSNLQKTRSTFKGGCSANRAVNCGGLIQYDNWQIKDDYPW